MQSPPIPILPDLDELDQWAAENERADCFMDVLALNTPGLRARADP